MFLCRSCPLYTVICKIASVVPLFLQEKLILCCIAYTQLVRTLSVLLFLSKLIGSCAGVTIGLSLRFGVSLGPDISLPESYWRTFVSESLASPTVETCSSGEIILSDSFKAALMRQGITTVVPEVFFLDAFILFVRFILFFSGDFKLLGMVGAPQCGVCTD